MADGHCLPYACKYGHFNVYYVILLTVHKCAASRLMVKLQTDSMKRRHGKDRKSHTEIHIWNHFVTIIKLLNTEFGLVYSFSSVPWLNSLSLLP